MQTNELTPLEIIRKQKAELRDKSGALAKSIENRTKYVQKHFAPLIRDSVVESAVSKMPTPLRGIAGSLYGKRQKSDVPDIDEHQGMQDMMDIPLNQGNSDLTIPKLIQGAAIGVTEIAPFLLRGKKGMLISFLLKQIGKRLKR